MSAATMPTVADYSRIFEAERQNKYPVIDAFESRMGYAINRAKLEEAARALACPLKKNPPNWQHGRVIYSAVCNRLAKVQEDTICALDIGTAKSYSALCMLWAIEDSGMTGRVQSVDVIDPNERVRRNTVAEVDGFKTLSEILAPWPEAERISFYRDTGLAFVSSRPPSVRFHAAFVDGKHSTEVVIQEGLQLAIHQHKGDLAIFDDLQLISPAVDQLERNGLYAFERLWAKKDRGYAVGVRRG